MRTPVRLPSPGYLDRRRHQIDSCNRCRSLFWRLEYESLPDSGRNRTIAEVCGMIARLAERIENRRHKVAISRGDYIDGLGSDAAVCLYGKSKGHRVSYSGE